MFTFNKTVVCLEFSKTSVFCALAQITGRKVDIIAVDSIEIESGILEEGIIYDVPHLQQIVTNLVTSVSHSHNKVDAAWISIPDNQISITKFEVEKEKKGILEEDMHKAIEEKFNFSASKLYLINRPIHELNRKIFFLANAVRVETLESYVKLFEHLNIPVEAIFPTFQCLFEEYKKQFETPTLLLYPATNGFKFFVADNNGVYLESVWGHNVIELDENFDKAVLEVIQYAKQSKEVALGVKKIIVIESDKLDSDKVQAHLQKIGINFSWIQAGSQDSEFDPISVVILKGLLKISMAKEFSKGFLEPQITHYDDIRVPLATVPKRVLPETLSLDEQKDITPPYSPEYAAIKTKNTMTKNENDYEERWDWKVILGSILIGLVLIGLMAYIGSKAATFTKDSGSNMVEVTSTPETTSTIPPTFEPTPTTDPTPTPTAIPTPTPTLAPLTKNDVRVLVLNGNNKAGEASVISGILAKEGYKTKKPDNNPVRGIQSTTVTYKDPRAKALAEEAAKLIEPSYPSAKAVLDEAGKEDILVVLGAR